jgi:O-antigen/teichoic acid export membrane protein
MFSLIAIASPLIEIVLTSKWIDTVIILQILCLGFMWDPIGFLNINLLYIKGKPKSILRLEIVKKSIAIIILFTSIPFGITYIAIGRAFYSFLAVYINTYFTKKLISFTYVHQIKLIFPNFVLSLIMSLSAYYLSLFISSLLLKLVFIVIFSVIFYSSISYLFKFEEFKIILEFIKKIRTKK